MSGYDLDRAFQESVAHFWTTDRSQIYRTLHKLHGAGLLDVEHVQQDDYPDKKIYRVTPTGEAALQEWLATPIPEPPVREGWLGQIFFGHRTDPDTLIQVLEHYRDDTQAICDTLSTIRSYLISKWDDAMPQSVQYRLFSLEFGLKLHRAALEWYDETIEQIKQMNRK